MFSAAPTSRRPGGTAYADPDVNGPMRRVSHLRESPGTSRGQIFNRENYFYLCIFRFFFVYRVWKGMRAGRGHEDEGGPEQTVSR